MNLSIKKFLCNEDENIMRKYNILRIGFVVVFSLTLLGCSKKNKGIEDYTSIDANVIKTLAEDFVGTSSSRKFIHNGIDETYTEFNGNKNLMSVYSNGVSETIIMYNAQFTSGSAKVVIVDPNGNVTELVKTKGDGSKELLLPAGKSVIKLLGNKATGNLQIQIPYVDSDLISNDAEPLKDGDYFFYKYDIDDKNQLSIRIMRLEVVEGKIEKMAHLDLDGKLINGIAEMPYYDDGWGNSGTVKVNLQDDLLISITINSRRFPSVDWGIEEGNFAPNDMQLPDFMK